MSHRTAPSPWLTSRQQPRLSRKMTHPTATAALTGTRATRDRLDIEEPPEWIHGHPPAAVLRFLPRFGAPTLGSAGRGQ